MRQSPDFLLISQAAAAAFAAVRLLHFSLRRYFPVLLSYLLLIVASSLVFSFLSATSGAYYWAYLTYEPVYWVVGSLAVREMFALIFRDYPGLRTAGRWAIYTSIALSVAVFLLIREVPRSGPTRAHLLLDELILDRWIVFSLAIVIVVLMMFLTRYPLDLDRNAYVASGFFSAMFVADAAVKLIDSLSLHLYTGYVDDGEVVFTSLCFVGWGVMLNAIGTKRPVRAEINNLRETELLHQLDSLNGILSRSVRW